jgi:hypothetical protein
MLNVLDDLIRRHRNTGILVDTNMLLVYLVGLLNREWVSEVSPNRAYSSDDFELVSNILGRFNLLIVTPAVLAEVSNLSTSRLSAFQRQEFLKFLARLLPTAAFTEQLAALVSVTAANGFTRFGFTDATIEKIGASGVPIFTDDANLYQYLASRKVEVFNYNHIRMLAS